MSKKPNVLIFMVDQMRGQVLEEGSPCLTPHLDNLMKRGVAFQKAYTPNAVCSPARASLMTGLLPSNHGVLQVTHNVDDDQSVLRKEKPHFAQALKQDSYKTGYFGKWHVERSYDMPFFGWDESAVEHSEAMDAAVEKWSDPDYSNKFSLESFLKKPGYIDSRMYSVTSVSPEKRTTGIPVSLGIEFLDRHLGQEDPWACFISILDPHDPYICNQEAFDLYDVDALELPENVNDKMFDKPGLYRKAALSWKDMSLREKKEAMACYYANITEADAQLGRVIERLEEAGELDETIILFTSDHGDHMGEHGLYCKNIGAFEGAYRIPLIMAGPGIHAGKPSKARMALHDVFPTLMDCLGLETPDDLDGKSFINELKGVQESTCECHIGFSEFYGGRYDITQRIVWKDDWKFVHNGFDYDELYNLKLDPGEQKNLAAEPEFLNIIEEMCLLMWVKIKDAGNHTLVNTEYPALRLSPFGPNS